MDCKKREKSVHFVDIKILKIEVQEEELKDIFVKIVGLHLVE